MKRLTKEWHNQYLQVLVCESVQQHYGMEDINEETYAKLYKKAKKRFIEQKKVKIPFIMMQKQICVDWTGQYRVKRQALMKRSVKRKNVLPLFITTKRNLKTVPIVYLMRST